MKGWTSGNDDIDKFIKDTIYNARQNIDDIFLEWIPYNRFIDIRQIGEGGFAEIYSAIWVDSNSSYYKDNEGWKKLDSKPKKVALRKLKRSQNISAEYLNEIKILWNLYKFGRSQHMHFLDFYGMTKDPETEEYIMIIKFANKGNLRSILSNNFKNLLWNDKISLLCDLLENIKNLHKLGIFHKDLHSGNILQDNFATYVTDFGLSGPANEQKSNDKICGVLPYIAPEILYGGPYTLSSDIYSIGVIMAELSSGKPPFHKREHDQSLALQICTGLRPDFGKGTPVIYKELSLICMYSNPNQRPTAEELYSIISFWHKSMNGYYYKGYQEKEEYGYKRKEIEFIFKEADKEIPNILTSYEKELDAIYTSRLLTFDLTSALNSSIITSYLDEEDN
ncbi:kinase-like domain-containing protein [Rhizophagus irregularis DAOM 181602=DAOM 197198]|nr:kinase-like domain-containing protein [Rhizophagus irregularis DAOM 181602=DAOM 197198]POG83086.1 kinase-like domain-containing protein [Rhizophagus irregularis DAOM 181602=DAOM 197198]|eukprot:XP_025189952.1 kinase-like domain-containing protein [Rhizophagus irregularis DAOM 181602=DAOM 197198]